MFLHGQQNSQTASQFVSVIGYYSSRAINNSACDAWLRNTNNWIISFFFAACKTVQMPSPLKHSFNTGRIVFFSHVSQSIVQYMGLCVFRLPTSLVMIEITYTLSYYHHQIASMNCYQLFRVRSWNNGMRCMSFYSYAIFCVVLSTFLDL